MPIVASVDYVNKRIYLNASTVNSDVDTLEVYKDVRALRVLNENHRKYKPMIISGGNVPKIIGVSATPIFVQLLYGCRIIPYGTGDHAIRVVRDTFTDDGFAGVDCFDRNSLTNSVDIDVDFPEVEIRYAAGGGGSTPADIWNENIDGSYTAAQLMRIFAGVLSGKVSGAGTGTEIFRDINDTKNRLVADVDSNGNRTGITIDAN